MKTSPHERRFASLPVIPERNHILLVAALSFLLGALSIFHLTVGPWLWAVFALGLLLGIIFRKAGIALFVCLFALGSLYTNAVFETDVPPAGTYRIAATIHGGAALRSDGRISFALTDIHLDGEAVPGKAYCTLHYDTDAPPELFDGAAVALDGRVYEPGGKSGVPRFDFRLWTRQQGYDFCIASYQGIELHNTPETASVSDWAYRVRQFCRLAYERVMGENARVAMALLFGERDGLSDDEYLDFQHLGIAHIMSVSGLHVALLGGLMMRLLHLLKMKRAQSLAVLLAFLAAYCAVTGFSAAANRAAIMLLLSFLANLWQRRPDRIILLSSAMLLVLCINPLHAHSAGFVLSFSAMAGITLYCQVFEHWLDLLWTPFSETKPKTSGWRTLGRLQRGLKSGLALSVAAQIGVLLPTVYYFHQLPLYGILINLIIVPLVSLVLVPLYALCLPLSFLPGVGHLAGMAASVSTSLLLWLVDLLARLPHASVRIAAPPMITVIGIGAALVLLSRRVPGRLGKRLLAASLTLAVALGAGWMQKPADVRYIQLSVGQADSALLMDGDATILIDTAVDGSAAIDYLLHENRDIDALILTHLHVDHAGGVASILENEIGIHHVYLPVMAESQHIDPLMADMLALLKMKNVPISVLASGDELRYNKVGIEVLWPERKTVRTGQNANHYPLVLSIDLDGYTILQMSDLAGSYENYAARPADVLKAAHHGSYTSTYEPFLDFVSPSAALLSVSSGSRYHPSPGTLERFDARGIPYFRTDECGDITLNVEDGKLLITPYLKREEP